MRKSFSQKLTCLVFIITFLLGCYSGYGLHCNINFDPDKELSHDELAEALGTIVTDVAYSYGFQKDKFSDPGIMAFYRDKNDSGLPKADKLNGSDSFVSLAYDQDYSLIALRDFRNYRETEFISKVKDELILRINKTMNNVDVNCIVP